jgi:hypothetical protein
MKRLLQSPWFWFWLPILLISAALLGLYGWPGSEGFEPDTAVVSHYQLF